MGLTIERRAVGYDASWQKVPNDRLPVAKRYRLQGSVEVRRVDAGMQPAQTALRGQSTHASGGSWITFVSED